MSFKVGDRVQVVRCFWDGLLDTYIPEGAIGVVSFTDSKHAWIVVDGVERSNMYMVKGGWRHPIDHLIYTTKLSKALK